MPDDRNLVKTLGERFISRKDVKAFQHDDGSWHPERSPFTMGDFRAHLAGERTLGHYMLDQDGQTKLLAFDIDLIQPKPNADPPVVPMLAGPADEPEPLDPRAVWLDREDPRWPYLCVNLRCVAEGIALCAERHLRWPVAISDSGGKGLHVYVFTGLMNARMARASGRGILTQLGLKPSRGNNFFKTENWDSLVEVEMFPKQDTLEGKDLGNLMKLPLGVNRKTGNRADFLTCETGYDRLASMDPIEAMDGKAWGK